MSKLPRLRSRQVIAALGKEGFQVVRVRGSHHFLQHADDGATVVPVHSGEQIGPGLLSKILHNCALSREGFEALF